MITAADMAPWGVGEPDEEGWYEDYRPGHPRPDAAPQPTKGEAEAGMEVTLTWLVEHWRLVLADLSLHHGVDLYADRDRPWPGVRLMIFSLLDWDTRLRSALVKRR